MSDRIHVESDGVFLLDTAGRVRAIVGPEDGAPEVALFDAVGNAAAGVSFDEQGRLLVVLLNDQGDGRAGFRVDDDGELTSLVYDSEGQPVRLEKALERERPRELVLPGRN